MSTVELFTKPKQAWKNKAHTIKVEQAKFVIVIACHSMEYREQYHIERLVGIFSVENAISI